MVLNAGWRLFLTERTGMKLSKAQAEVMEWANGGWLIRRSHGSVVEVNGHRLCRIDTMTALERLGLIERVGDHWKKKATVQTEVNT